MTRQYNQQPNLLSIIWTNKFKLVFYILGISILSFSTLYALGLVPEELVVIDEETSIATSTPSTSSAPLIATNNASQPQLKGELPERVIISKIGVNVNVLNPNTTDNDSLNNYLLKGTIRYPTSGTLGHGNLLILGHSTSLKIVNNQAFKAFVGLNKLNPGDIIQVNSGTKAYLYTVASVQLENSDEAFIDLSSDKNMLTLATCNTLGQKEERFIVKAVFSGTRSL